MADIRPEEHQISVCAITRHYWPVYSGAAIQMQRLYSALAGAGFQFTVLTRRSREAAGHPRCERVDGVQVHRLSVLPDYSFSTSWLDGMWLVFNNLFFSVTCMAVVACRRRKVDVVHIIGESLPIAVLLARLLRIPTIVRLTMLRPDQCSTAGHLFSRLNDWALMRANMTVSLSAVMKRQYENAGVDTANFVIIPQGVDLSAFHPVSDAQRTRLRQQLGLDPGARYVISVGAIQHRKGSDILVDAFVEASKACPSLRLIFVGQKDFSNHPDQRFREQCQAYQSSLETKLAEDGLADRVEWTGRRQPADVIRYLQASDIFCLPSRLEGVSSAVLEAMACGLPIIVSSLNGTSQELLRHGQEGFIVEGESASDYARFIGMLAADRGLVGRMGYLSRQRVEQAFSFQQTMERYREILRALAYLSR